MSPDGKWMAYASNETGRYEVWIEPFPRTGARYQVTRDGGSHPLWPPDGQSLYFDRDHQMFRLAVNTKDLSSIVEPTPLPIKGFAQAEYRRQFDLMPDGRQFLVLAADRPVDARRAAKREARPCVGAAVPQYEHLHPGCEHPTRPRPPAARLTCWQRRTSWIRCPGARLESGDLKRRTCAEWRTRQR